MQDHTLSGVSNSRVEALRQKHLAIESQISEALKSPSVTDFHIRSLKKEKLKLKEELESMRSRVKEAA